MRIRGLVNSLNLTYLLDLYKYNMASFDEISRFRHNCLSAIIIVPMGCQAWCCQAWAVKPGLSSLGCQAWAVKPGAVYLQTFWCDLGTNVSVDVMV